jgi:hypothetical protein
MTERQIERVIFFLRASETLFVSTPDTGTEIRALIAELERQKQTLKDGEKVS